MNKPSRFNSLLVLCLLLLSMIGGALAYTEQGDYGVTVYTIEPVGAPYRALALVLPTAKYAPGELMSLTVGTEIPCDTRKSVLTMIDAAGKTLYTKDISSAVGACTTSYVKITFSAPSQVGYYELDVSYYNGNGQILFIERTPFNVATGSTSCPLGYCSAITTVQKFEYGTLQQQTCYTYEAGTCKQRVSVFDNMKCDKGYTLEKQTSGYGNCVKPGGEQTCGDRVKQTGEQCDYGSDNGVCPRTCSTSCQTNACNTLPDEKPPADDGEKDQNDNMTPAYFVLGGIGFLALSFLVWRRK